MKKNDIQKITQGAMMLAIIGVFLLLNLQTAGLLAAYFVWLFPLPIIFYLVRFGFKATLVLVVATLILSFILGSVITLFYVFNAVVIGLVYGYGVSKDKDNGWLLFFTTLITAIGLFFEMYVFAAFFGYDLVSETHEIITLIQQIDGINVPADIESLVLSIYPLALIFTSFLQAIVTHIFSIYMLKRLKIKTRKMKDISKYRLPKIVAAFSFLALFLGSISIRYGGETNRSIMVLVITMATLILVSDAYILVVMVARKFKIRYLPILSVFMLVFLPSVSIYVFIGIGLLDSFTDFRERIIKLK